MPWLPSASLGPFAESHVPLPLLLNRWVSVHGAHVCFPAESDTERRPVHSCTCTSQASCQGSRCGVGAVAWSMHRQRHLLQPPCRRGRQDTVFYFADF